MNEPTESATAWNAYDARVAAANAAADAWGTAAAWNAYAAAYNAFVAANAG